MLDKVAFVNDDGNANNNYANNNGNGVRPVELLQIMDEFITI